MVRKPIASGNFYPGSKSILEEELGKYIEFSETKKKVIGLVSPHAGYVFSGSCAGKGFGIIEVPGIVIILGVNHYGFGHPFAVDGHDSWKTPLGEAEIHTELREKLVKDSKIFGIDSNASIKEHSLEVQVPFVQFINPEAKILPITVAGGDVQRLKAAGKEIAALIKDNPGDILMVASTDMSHFISADRAREKDKMAIDKILALDPEGLFNTVAMERISMCGASPTTIMLAAALELGAQKAEVIDYTNSGRVMADYSRVVAYLSMIVY
ncbi:MAG: AmmeMemoRadiSam system protein B [Candidatus Aminicenantes bacterium]|nr:MAG: AmmeMemoRadiSam system protein B [Candidatus Aminicenantes bacterium]